MDASERIIVAVDVSSVDQAHSLIKQLNPLGVQFKLGLELITGITAQLLSEAIDLEGAYKLLDKARSIIAKVENRSMWDTKLSDIPNTMAGAAKALGHLAPGFFTIHASSGKESIRAAVANKGSSRVLGVTVLTSIDDDECQSIFGENPTAKVIKFALDLVMCQADGIVCSPSELAALQVFGSLIKVTPGVRPVWAASGDQKRFTTPRKAIEDGADYLVIGRPITQPPPEVGSPAEAVRRIIEEIEQGLALRKTNASSSTQ